MKHRTRILAGPALLLLLAAGCASVRAARKAQDDANAVPGERTPTAKELGLESSGLLRLEDALRIAHEVHPSNLRARHDVEAARSRVGEIEGDLLPQLSVNASKTYSDQESTRGVSPSHHFQSLGFNLSWLLFDFGRTNALARQAGENWLAEQADARATAIDVDFGVRSAYFGLQKQLHLRDVAREAVAQFQEHLDQVREFVRVGTRIQYDATKAEVDLGNARLALVQAEDAALVAQATLANALGLAETTDWIPEDDAPLPAAPAPFEECWAIARRSRPALAAALARERAASELVNARVAALYPSLDLGFGFGFAGSTTPLPWSWSFGPGLSWVPFNGFTNLYTIDEATAALKSARASRAAAEQSAWLDVRNAWLAWQDAQRRLELSTLVVQNAEETVTLAQGRFDFGKGTSVELTDARQALVQARADRVLARADLDLATAGISRALGIPALAADTDPDPREPPPAARGDANAQGGDKP